MSAPSTDRTRDGMTGMHILVSGPMTLSILEPELGDAIPTAGFPFPGTSQLVLEYLARGHRVSALTTGSDIDRPVRMSGPRLELVVLPARGRGRGRAFDQFRSERRRLTAEIDRLTPDVVHAHWTYEFGLSARAARSPALVTVHDWAPAIARHNRHPYWYFRWLMQVRCLLRRGALSAPSGYIADRVERWYRQRCPVVPNGVDLERLLALPGSGGDHPVVAMLNVGFTDRKNVASALRAWPVVRAAFPEAELVLAGADFEPDGLAAGWAHDQGLATGVTFRGPLDPSAVPDLLKGADVFLHTSREESFGIVLVEAMAAGRPVVAGARSGAAPDVVGDGGLLVDVDDPSSVAGALLRLLQDPDLRADLAERGRRRARMFDLETSVDRYLDLLGGIAHPKPDTNHPGVPS